MATKGLPLSRVTNVTVTLSARAAQGRNFGSMLLLGDSTVIPITERLRLYSSADDIGDDFGVDSQEYAAAVIWFSQSPQPTQIYVGRWAKTLAVGETGSPETLIQAVNALMDYTSWYGLHLAVPEADYPSDTDLLAVSAAIQAATVSRIFGVTTNEADTLDASVTTDLASQLKAAAYGRTFIQYSTHSRYAALSAFARAFTVDFTASNTTITLKFKQEPGVTYETLSTSQANNLEAKKLQCLRVLRKRYSNSGTGRDVQRRFLRRTTRTGLAAERSTNRRLQHAVHKYHKDPPDRCRYHYAYREHRSSVG
ncbi:hypothetical protein OS11_39350 [Dickeya oryzae]